MPERGTARLPAWRPELRRAPSRLREALSATRRALDQEADAATVLRGAITRDLLLLCHGFCTALDAHHRGEDRRLFPAIEAEHPELAPVLRRLEQDHSMLSHLLGELARAADGAGSAEELELHLDGVSALMESHFRYEERQLLAVLEDLALEDDAASVLGPL